MIIVRVDYADIEAALNKNLTYLYKLINQLALTTFSNAITLSKGNYLITIFNRDNDINKNMIINLLNKSLKSAGMSCRLLKTNSDVKS